MTPPGPWSPDFFLGLAPPGAVLLAQSYEDDSPGSPFEQEQEQVAACRAFRRREYLASRNLARAALGRLGVPPVALPKTSDGDVVWPEGIAGSLTHTKQGCAVLVAKSSAYVGVGVDAEDARRMTPPVAQRIMLPAEVAQSQAFDGPQPLCGTLFFSAKEAVFKAVFPLTRRFMGFRDVRIDWRDLSPGRGAFAVEAASREGGGAAGVQGMARWEYPWVLAVCWQSA